MPASSSRELTASLRRSRAALGGVAAFSGLINLLALASSIYMLQLYDRVLPAHSVSTLVALSLLMIGLYFFLGLFEWVRARIMNRIAQRLDRSLRARVFGLVVGLPLGARAGHDALQPVSDLDQMRHFLSGPGPVALIDMPWMPFYLMLVWLLHPWLGMLALGGAAVLVGLTIATEVRSRQPARASAGSAVSRRVFAEAARRNAEVVRALGMEGRLAERWMALGDRHNSHNLVAADMITGYAALSRVLRLVIQSAVLGLGAYLVIGGQATGGVMIAASILASRALAPIEVAIGNWKSFLAARDSATRLEKLLASFPSRSDAMALPKPEASLTVDGLWVAAPGAEQAILRNVGFTLSAGAALGIIGPSASGKSTLARALVGVWPPLRGSVRLDGAALDQWTAEALGRHVGYLPQDIELFDGTVAQNIGRFQPSAEPTHIIAAAREAGIHEMVLGLKDGYETRIGEGGAVLSAGQRQRLALARALYGDPFLLVLDEPNSNLDSAGDAALARAIGSVRARRGIVVVVAHRPSALSGCDQVLVLADGQVQAFGPRDDVLRTVLQSAPPSRFKVVADSVTS